MHFIFSEQGHYRNYRLRGGGVREFLVLECFHLMSAGLWKCELKSLLDLNYLHLYYDLEWKLEVNMDPTVENPKLNLNQVSLVNIRVRNRLLLACVSRTRPH